MRNKSVLAFLNKISGQTKINMGLLILLQMLLGIMGICYALFLREIINEAVDGNRNGFFMAVFRFLALIGLRLLFRALVRFLEEETRSTLENRLKEQLFSSLLYKEFASVSATHSGEWMHRLTSDTVVVANGMTEILPRLGGMAVKLVGAVIMIILLEPRFCYLLVPVGMGLLVFSTSFRRIMKKLHKNVQEKDGKLRVFLQEMLSSMLVLRSFAIEDRIEIEAKEKMELHKQARMKRNHFSNICNLGFGIIMDGAYVLGAFFCGYGILTQTMSYGTFTAVLQLIGQVQSPFANISGFLPRYYAMIASAERLMEAEILENAKEDGSYTFGEIQFFYDNQFQRIGLRNACFTYLPPTQSIGEEKKQQKMPIVLKEINLELRKGEYISFIGPSGCGKSTVLKVMMCLYPLDSGERYLATEEGEQPLDTKWQKLFAYVPQGNHLMSGSIREIVALSDKEKMQDEKRIRRALTIACAIEFVDRLEQGVDTLLGEHGLGLSEGQMQRLAIARAIFSERPILMLDECTSALDETTERKVLTNLRSMTDKTVLIVTHRTAVLQICDKVVMFTENGCTINQLR
ncbi:MAG: ABC transporter ATP-binding protein [Lachnospiraceae bacterium]